MTGHKDAAAPCGAGVRDAFTIADGSIVRHGKSSESIHAAALCVTRVAFAAAVTDDGISAHVESGILVPGPHMHTAATLRGAAADAAAGHRKVAFNIHTAALAAHRRAADNIATLHGQFAAGFDTHTAADFVDISLSVGVYLLVLITRAAGDDAAVDGFRTIGFIQYPQAVRIGRELVFSGGAAVLDGQVRA